MDDGLATGEKALLLLCLPHAKIMEADSVETVAQNNPESTLQSGRPSKRRSRSFALMVSLLIVLTMCSYWLISNYNTRNLLQQQADRLGGMLAQQTAAQLTELVLANDLVSMNVVLTSLTSSETIAAAEVLNVDRQLLAAAEGTTDSPELLVPLPIDLTGMEAEYLAPITLADSLAGYVRLRLDLGYIEVATLNNLLLISGATLLLVIVAALLTSTWFQTTVSFPANLLAFSLKNIRQGKIETCPEPKHEDEMGSAIRQYNATAEFLAQNTFLDNVGKRLPESELQQPGIVPGHQDVTLLCIRLANFQYLASISDETHLTELLNRFYFFAGKVSQLYGGRIAYCADGEVIVNFGDLPLEEEQAFYAVCAGQLFLQLIDQISESDHIGTSVKFRLAAHSGAAVTGLFSPITNASDNLMGRTLDLCRQLCDGCPDNELLISGSCLQHAGADTRVRAEKFAEAGDADGITTYLSHEPVAEYQVLIERQASQLVTLYSN